MKNTQLLSICLSVCLTAPAFAQVEIDKPVNMTGVDGDRKITNLELPVAGTDAVNKDYVDAAVSAGGGGGANVPSAISAKSPSQLSFKDAVQYCDGLSEGGNTDWRLPDFDEVTYFVGSTADTDFLWTKEKATYDIATNQNYVSTRLSDGKWSKAGIVSRFLPRTESSSTILTPDWTTVLTVLPTIGDLLLLPNFSLSNARSGCCGPYSSHRMIITFADGGTLTLGDYSASSSSTVRYQFSARDMEEAWMFGPIQKIEVQQSGSAQGATYGASASISMTSAYEIILSQAEGGTGLYARCVR